MDPDQQVRDLFNPHKVIIIEGPKSCGKTTFRNHLLAQLYPKRMVYKTFIDTPFWKSGYTDQRWGLDPTQGPLYAIDYLRQFSPEERPWTIIDRFYLSCHILNGHLFTKEVRENRLALYADFCHQVDAQMVLIYPSTERDHREMILSRSDLCTESTVLQSALAESMKYQKYIPEFCRNNHLPLWIVHPIIGEQRAWEIKQLYV